MSGDESRNDSRDGSVVSGGFQNVDIGPAHDVFGLCNNFFPVPTWPTLPEKPTISNQTIYCKKKIPKTRRRSVFCIEIT